MKDIAALIISLLITMAVLHFIKLPPVLGFIIGSILWSILHFNLKKKL